MRQCMLRNIILPPRHHNNDKYDYYHLRGISLTLDATKPLSPINVIT